LQKGNKIFTYKLIKSFFNSPKMDYFAILQFFVKYLLQD